MNERIQELAEQAESFAETAYNKQTMATFHTNKSAEEIFREKFAELIVKECIQVVDDTMTENQEMNIGLVMASAKIVAHFEVEE